MLKKTIAAGLLACAATLPATAQDNKPAAQQSQNANQEKIQFIREIDAKQFRSSDFVGQAVYNLENENIGEIGDVLMDRSGKLAGVVIDVGGFLGIGESEVAVPFSALKFEPRNDQTASVQGSGNETAAGRSAAGDNASFNPATPAPGTPAADQPNRGTGLEDSNATDPGTANLAKGTAEVGTTGEGESAASGLNARIVLATSRDDLEAAPKLNEENADSGSGNQPKQ